MALIFGLCAVAVAGPRAQAPTRALTDKDRSEIRQLSDNYVTALDGCKAKEYAGLFTPDGMFISGPRGHLMGHEQLEQLVTSERHCQPNASTRSSVSHAFTKVEITPTADGASGRVSLPGAEPGASGGHYEDIYVKTDAGWRFKSRTYLSPKEETAAK